MNKAILIGTVAVGITLLVIHEWRLGQAVTTLKKDRDSLIEEVKNLGEKLQAVPQPIQEKLDRAQAELAMTEARLNGMTARAAQLERQLQTMQAQTARLGPPGAATFRPPGTEPATPPAEYAAVFPKRRHWGPEEVTGPPDTDGAGDIPTAWASLRSNGGPEWLKLEYDNAVNVAEVRVRETHNPGAITKVTAFLANGTEVVLWEGTAAPAQAPNDFVVPVTQPVTASQIKVYLDSQRVPGWNEIDAVELVGKDGTRQWAKNASASSTYAEPGNRFGFETTLRTLYER
jgi:hypothetical protein